MSGFTHIESDGAPIKAWTQGVPIEDSALKQLRNVASLPFIHKHVAVMPDVHWGMGATVGSVIPTYKAIIPAAVGVDIGCGMMAVRTSIRAEYLPDNLFGVRSDIEAAVPHGRTDNGGRNDKGAWQVEPPAIAAEKWAALKDGYDDIVARNPKAGHPRGYGHLGTLGTGNHFVELCVDEAGDVWVMLHSGSRGVGNRFGTYFIERAKHEMRRWFINLPDEDLAYFAEGSEGFNDYVRAVAWAQKYALANREVMMDQVLTVLRKTFPDLTVTEHAVNCHHNYVSREKHFGKDVYLTRKGAVSAKDGELGIIPGSMGAKSFIVRGRGNPDSFCTCSHGAGRAMSRNEAKRRFTLADHVAATAGVECRKDADVIDETPMAYKDIDAVMAAQADLVDIVHTLRQVVCVKG
ncbi:RtcB family protein [Caulobacter sp. 602-1]|uniref:RtcB family protein n=1 Tax=Caulobacter sp. 602-1 TaxID=2492472 RepID=UPI000F6420B7|nr:RtcB family protein [Caulobacter sp. 602-1]RRN62712.1 RtcB family protein [Caulobacter sp. 602-1]